MTSYGYYSRFCIPDTQVELMLPLLRTARRSFSRLTRNSMPVPFTSYKSEAELAVLAVLRGCYL